MKCTLCGNKITSESFCTKCGAPAPAEKPDDTNAAKATPSEITEGFTAKNISPWLLIIPIVVLILSFTVTLLILLNNDSPKRSKQGKDDVFLVLSNDELYAISGDKTALLSSEAEGIEVFASTELIADGTFFIVDNHEESDSIYDDFDEDVNGYTVGDLIMITPNGDHTKIDEDVYEVVFSQFDDVCYYQVIEENRQKICVVKNGQSYDVSGWVYGNVDYNSGPPNGECVYFTAHYDSGDIEACIGKDGSYQVVSTNSEYLRWLVNDDEAPMYLAESEDDIYQLTAYKEGTALFTLSDLKHFEYSWITGTLAVRDSDDNLVFYFGSDKPVTVKSGMTDDDRMSFADTRGWDSNMFLCSFKNVLYMMDVSSPNIKPVRIGEIDDWRYIYNVESNSIYITGDPDAIYYFKPGSTEVEEVPLEDSAAYFHNLHYLEKNFYYVTGDSDYDFTKDTSDLYYYNGSKHLLLAKDADWITGNVLSVFKDKKLIWQANDKLYMANADGEEPKVILRHAWWVVEVNGSVYALNYDGDLYMIDKNGDRTLLLEDVDEFLEYSPEW